VLAFFVNHMADTLDLAWSMDAGQTWTHFSSVPPGQHTSLNTYVGHLWRFTLLGGGEEVQRWAVPSKATGNVFFYSDSAEPVDENAHAPEF